MTRGRRQARQRQSDRAAIAREAKAAKRSAALSTDVISISSGTESDDNISVCDWDGSINNTVLSSDDSDYPHGSGSSSEWDDESDFEVSEEDADKIIEKLTDLAVERENWVRNLQNEAADELESLERATPYDKLGQVAGKKVWKKAEKHLRTGVHTGTSKRTQQHHNKVALEKERKDVVTRKG